MKYLRRQKKTQEGVDVSPLIDMVFILLIFFMVSTTFIKDMQVDLNRPGAASAKPSSSKSIRVFIDRNEKVYVDGQRVRPWILQGKLRDMTKAASSSSAKERPTGRPFRLLTASRIQRIDKACCRLGLTGVGT